MTDADVFLCFKTLMVISGLIVLCMYAPSLPTIRRHRKIHQEEEVTIREIGEPTGPASYTYTEYGVERTVKRGTEEYNLIADAMNRR